MTTEAFRKFLESQAKKKPLKLEGQVDKAEVLRDAQEMARVIKPDDLETIKRSWQKKSFEPIAVVLREYGLEFKGIIYTESLVTELFRLMEKIKIQ